MRPDPAIYADWQLNGYLAYHAERFRSRLTDYNAKEKLAIDARGSASVRTIFKTRLVETKDKRVVMDIGFNVGTPPNMEVVEHTFDLEWRDGHLEVVGHRG